PWTVSIDLGEAPRRTTIRAVAWAADGSFIGEDAVVLNGPAGQLPVAILLAPEQPGETTRVVTVATGRAAIAEVSLRADERTIARWEACPCVLRVPVEELRQVKTLVAEVRGQRGTRGEAVKVLAGKGFVQEVRVDLVELPVVVIDASGEPVSGLTREAFRVREDGREIEIDAFGTTADLPLDLGILVDTSGSMKEAFPKVRQAVADFAGSLLRAGDRFFLMTFAWEPRLDIPWSSDARLITNALDRLEPDGGTSLHDSVVRALEQFRSRRGRHALVLLTDGDDTTSRTDWDVALRFCRTARTPVFPIGFRVSKLDFFLRDHLRDLAAATGGEAFFAKGENLAEVYRRISEQLRAQYLISYRSPSAKPADELRLVKVEVRGEGLQVRTIAGYFPGW
ncbi:MAG: VWA domain-containing protein, partial [Acidobacteriota bacterium]